MTITPLTLILLVGVFLVVSVLILWHGHREGQRYKQRPPTDTCSWWE